jgi:hypothetical protein
MIQDLIKQGISLYDNIDPVFLNVRLIFNYGLIQYIEVHMIL